MLHPRRVPGGKTTSVVGFSPSLTYVHSRQDAYFGSPVKFNATIFAETQSYWHGPVINTTMAAKARVARIRTSNATNPEFGLSQTGVTFSLGEAAAYLMFLGERVNLTAPKNVVEYLFGEFSLVIYHG